MKYNLWNNIWKGNSIPNNERTLILGESHYGDENGTDNSIGKEVPYTTMDVVNDHIKGIRKHRFFDKIAESFGYSKESVTEFYNRVYFANYVPVLCAKREKNKAKDYIEINKNDYNSDLFEFVNTNRIDTIYCFSRTSYWGLPNMAKDEYVEEFTIGKIGKNNNYVGVCEYKAGVLHGNSDIVLDRPLRVYGFRHPSCGGGFDAGQVYGFLMNVEDLTSKNLMLN